MPIHDVVLRSIVVVMLGVTGYVFPATGLAQSDAERVKELERKLEQALDVVKELANRVKELEARTARPSQPPPAAPQVEEHHERRGPVVGDESPPPPTILRGFADVGANFSGNRGNKGFFDGSLDFYLTPQLSANVRSVIELVFEHDNTGVLEADLERLQVGYSFTNGTTVWLGRFHTPLGYWNTAFHHGQQLQTSILRPQMIDFEDRGGVIPAHTVGVWGTGAKRAGDGRVTYDLFGGNSPSINANTLDPNNSGKNPPGYSSGFNLGYLFGGSTEGLKIGVHGYRADVRDDAVIANVTRVNLLGGYAAVDSPLWELIAEYYKLRNQDISGGTGHFGSWTGFVHLGRHIGRWTPYGRVEKADLNQADHYFFALATGRSYRRQLLGLRYDLTSNTALKLELTHQTTETTPPATFDQLLMQWAIRF